MQILRPITDTLVNGFTPTPSSPATLWDKLDDGGGIVDDGGSADSAAGTFIEQDFEVRLAAGGAPATPGTCTLYVTAAKQVGAVAAQDMVVELREGATLRGTTTVPSLSGFATEYSFTVSSTVISGWTDLRVYVKRTATVTACFIVVHNLRFEAPDPGFEHMVPSASGFQVAAAGSGSYLVVSGPGFRKVDGLEVAGALIPANSAGFKIL